MVVQVRGTSGSGKSTVMRQVMEELAKTAPWERVYVNGRKRPLYYKRKDVVVLGHYEAPCGGGDTIGSAGAVCRLGQELLDTHPEFNTVLCEGLLLSGDVKWSVQLKDLRVVYLATDLDTCLQRINHRRSSVGNDKPLNPKATVGKFSNTESTRIRLTAAGVHCRRASCEQAPGIILRWLGEQ